MDAFMKLIDTHINMISELERENERLTKENELLQFELNYVKLLIGCGFAKDIKNEDE